MWVDDERRDRAGASLVAGGIVDAHLAVGDDPCGLHPWQLVGLVCGVE